MQWLDLTKTDLVYYLAITSLFIDGLENWLGKQTWIWDLLTCYDSFEIIIYIIALVLHQIIKTPEWKCKLETNIAVKIIIF